MMDLISRQSDVTDINVGDTIYRQSAIDVVMHYGKRIPTYAIACKAGLEQLPSIQPEFTEQDVRDAFNDGYSCGMESAQTKFEERTAESAQNVPNGELIPKKAVIEAINAVFPVDPMKSEYAQGIACGAALAKTYVEQLPSMQSERDTPIKPVETTDRAWGIPHRQAVCPKCDYYLGNVAFLGDYKGKRITYCETCGQAIDWEGWDFDE